MSVPFPMRSQFTRAALRTPCVAKVSEGAASDFRAAALCRRSFRWARVARRAALLCAAGGMVWLTACASDRPSNTDRAGDQSQDPGAGSRTAGDHAGAPRAKPAWLDLSGDLGNPEPVASDGAPALWVRPGHTLVVPIKPGQQAIADGTVPCSIGGAPPAQCELVWVQVESPPLPKDVSGARADASVRQWIGTAGVWSGASAKDVKSRLEDDLRPRASGHAETWGCWVALVPIPQAAAPGEVAVDGRTLRVTWGADPPPGAVQRLSKSPHRAGGGQGAIGFLERVVRELRRSPLTRWRARLCDAEPILATTARAHDAFDNPAIEAIASQVESRMHASLARLERADRELAGVVRRALTRMIDARLVSADGGADPIPLPASDADISQLMRSIEAPSATPPQIVASALAWLSALPSTGAWVMDDAPAPDLGEGGTIRLGALNLSSNAMSAIVGAPGARAPEAAELAPMSMTPMAISISAPASSELDSEEAIGQGVVGAARVLTLPREPGRTVSPGLTARVRIGTWSAERACVPRPVPATPPGLAIGPLAPDFSAAAFLAHATERSASVTIPMLAPDCTTVGRLLKDPATGGWVVYVECARPLAGRWSSAENDPNADRIELHLGPTQRPVVVLTIASDGRVFQGTSVEGTPVDRVRVVQSDGWWSAFIPVPDKAIERRAGSRLETPASRVRLGVVRIDPTGVRSAWPRPMLPWQTAPGRTVIDLGAWDAPGAEDAGRSR